MRILLDSLAGVPATVFDRHLTVIMSNAAALALGPAFEAGSNLARFTFRAAENDTAGLEDWKEKQEQMAAVLRRSLRRYQEDGVFLDVIGDLMATSPAFAAAWAGEAEVRFSGVYTFVHPEHGRFDLMFHLFDVDDVDGDTLVLWSPADDVAAALLRASPR